MAKAHNLQQRSKIDYKDINTRAKLINYKNAAQLALLMLKEEGGSSDVETIDSL